MRTCRDRRRPTLAPLLGLSVQCTGAFETFTSQAHGVAMLVRWLQVWDGDALIDTFDHAWVQLRVPYTAPPELAPAMPVFFTAQVCRYGGERCRRPVQYGLRGVRHVETV